jgi:hypothetical protein
LAPIKTIIGKIDRSMGDVFILTASRLNWRSERGPDSWITHLESVLGIWEK